MQLFLRRLHFAIGILTAITLLSLVILWITLGPITQFPVYIYVLAIVTALISIVGAFLSEVTSAPDEQRKQYLAFKTALPIGVFFYIVARLLLWVFTGN